MSLKVKENLCFLIPVSNNIQPSMLNVLRTKITIHLNLRTKLVVSFVRRSGKKLQIIDSIILPISRTVRICYLTKSTPG